MATVKATKALKRASKSGPVGKFIVDHQGKNKGAYPSLELLASPDNFGLFGIKSVDADGNEKSAKARIGNVASWFNTLLRTYGKETLTDDDGKAMPNPQYNAALADAIEAKRRGIFAASQYIPKRGRVSEVVDGDKFAANF